MNMMITFDRVLTPVPDWLIKGTIQDDSGNVLYDFGSDGLSINTWWNSQPDEFQREYVLLFSAIIGQQLIGND
jgi:hypothetical protein